MLKEAKQRAAEYLLAELKTNKQDWYYISCANHTFLGGFIIRAFGPTDAWRLLHALNLWPGDGSTETTGPIPDESMTRIPEQQRWRKLTKEEALNLGKE